MNFIEFTVSAQIFLRRYFVHLRIILLRVIIENFVCYKGNRTENHKISMSFLYTNNANTCSECAKETIKQFYTVVKALK